MMCVIMSDLFEEVVAEIGEEFGCGGASNVLLTESLTCFSHGTMEEGIVLETGDNILYVFVVEIDDVSDTFLLNHHT